MTNMVTLVSNTVWHHGRLIMARLKLVVATKLHKQHYSFRLRISSNMSSCSEESHEWNILAKPKGMRFLFCSTGLRNAWTNRHNSGQHCNLEELINQANRPLNKLHPRRMASNARMQKSRESSPILRSVLLLGKEWWRLGEDVISVQKHSWLAYKIAFGCDQNNKS
jgi:hypothetical protein